MLTRKQFRCMAVFTLFIFTCFTLTLDYSYSQEENPLLKAHGLYKQGNFTEAVKVLEAFVEKVKDNPNEKKRLAEANLLLARIYYEAGRDARVLDYLKLAVAADVNVGKDEGNLDFKAQLERAREERLKSQAADKEAALAVTKEKVKTEVAQPIVKEKEKPEPQIEKKKKKFPWLLAVMGVGVAVVLVVLLTKKKKQTLNVTLGEGVTGTPGTGSYAYKKGDGVSYSYSLSSNIYENLQVKLDGNNVAPRGTISMDGNHDLFVSADKKATYVLRVIKGVGVDGDFATGIYPFLNGDVVTYNYRLQDNGYKNLKVTLDGNTVPASGTVTMNGNHNLVASAETNEICYLNVFIGAGVDGMPPAGSLACFKGTAINYSYTLQNNGYKNLAVKLDGKAVPASGTLIMNGNHNLVASAETNDIYYLNVFKGVGVDGVPATGSLPFFKGETVNYSYSLQSGYFNLIVKLDGIIVSSSGTIMMKENHALLVTAEKSAAQLLLTSGNAGTPAGHPAAYFDSISVVK